MIRINLVAERKAGTKGGGGGAAGTDGIVVLAGVVLLVLCCLVAAGNGILLMAEKSRRETTVELKTAKAKEYEADIQKLTELERQRLEFQRKVDAIGQLKANQSGPVLLLARIFEITPEEVTLSKLGSPDPRTVSLTATAKNMQVITTMYDNLKKTPEFSNIPEIKYQKTVGKGAKGSGSAVYNFSLSCRFTPPGTPADDLAAPAPVAKAKAKPKPKAKAAGSGD